MLHREFDGVGDNIYNFLTKTLQEPKVAAMVISIQYLQIHDIYAGFVQQFSDNADIRAELLRSDNDVRLLPNLREVRLVKGVRLKRNMLRSENCIKNGVTFTKDSLPRLWNINLNSCRAMIRYFCDDGPLLEILEAIE